MAQGQLGHKHLGRDKSVRGQGEVKEKLSKAPGCFVLVRPGVQNIRPRGQNPPSKDSNPAPWTGCLSLNRAAFLFISVEKL